MGSTFQLNDVAFIRNKWSTLLWLWFNSCAIIQNNTLIENNISYVLYRLYRYSIIQLDHVVFIQNELGRWFLAIESNCTAIIQNNSLIENNVSFAIYYIEEKSTIQLINVTFIRNAVLRNLLSMVSGSSAKLINNSMTGNNLDRMFFSQSSYLGIDTIFIKNNTFSQLLRLVECNVSFQSMKIRENKVTYGILYVENSVGRIANTYIKNSDNFSASAFTIICTYLRNRYYPFEITNIEIIGSCEVPVSGRAIIQLTGNFYMSNVKLLVTSLFETELLQYSTKNAPLSVSGVLKTFPTIFFISSLFISCTKASVKHIINAGTFRCIPCERGTYTLNNESLNTSLSSQSKKITKHENEILLV